MGYQFDSLTTRMPNGLTNADPWQTMAAAGYPDPTFAHVYANDFDDYTAAQWTATLVGTGTQALAAGDGGNLLITNTTGAADATYMQKTPATFTMTLGKQMFFKFAGTLSAVNLDVFFCGFSQSGATTQASITDGIYIVKATAQAGLVLNIVSNSVTTSFPLPSSCVLTAGTYFELGIMVDVLGNVAAFWNPTTGWTATIAAQNGAARGRVASAIAPTLPRSNQNLAPHFGLLNSSGVANTLTVDFIVFGKDR